MEGKRLKSSNSALYITAESADKKIVCAGSTTIAIETDVETWNCIGSDTKNKEVTGYDWKLDFDGKMRADGTETYKSLIGKLKGGTEIAVKSFMDVTENKVYGYGGNGIIKSINMSMSAPGVWEISVSIEGVGELEELTAVPTATANNA